MAPNLEADDELVRTIQAFTKEFGFSPSVRDLMVKLDLKSPSTVMKRLERLRDSGQVEWVPGRARTLRVVQ